MENTPNKSGKVNPADKLLYPTLFPKDALRAEAKRIDAEDAVKRGIAKIHSLQAKCTELGISNEAKLIIAIQGIQIPLAITSKAMDTLLKDIELGEDTDSGVLYEDDNPSAIPETHVPCVEQFEKTAEHIFENNETIPKTPDWNAIMKHTGKSNQYWTRNKEYIVQSGYIVDDQCNTHGPYADAATLCDALGNQMLVITSKITYGETSDGGTLIYGEKRPYKNKGNGIFSRKEEDE